MNPNAITTIGLIIALKGAAIGVAITVLEDIVTWANTETETWDWRLRLRKYAGNFAKGLLIGFGIAAS